SHNPYAPPSTNAVPASPSMNNKQFSFPLLPTAPGEIQPSQPSNPYAPQIENPPTPVSMRSNPYGPNTNDINQNVSNQLNGPPQMAKQDSNPLAPPPINARKKVTQNIDWNWLWNLCVSKPNRSMA
ncbi:hypothetical protein Kpol_109p1, partial [Vanderwaltozyma polyspora DSM 70294]